MLDLEERLRAEARQQANDFFPSADLPQRVAAGIRRRQRRRLTLAAAAGVVVIVVAAAGVAALGGDGARVEMGPPAQSPTTTPAPTTTAATSTVDVPATPTTPPTTSITTPTTTAPVTQVPPVDLGDQPLTWSGLGPIRSGDTLREAQAASGVEFTWEPASFENFGRQCFPASVPGVDHARFLVRSPDGTPLDDPLDGVIDVVGGPSAWTQDQVGADALSTDVTTVYGEPTRIEAVPMNEGQELWTYEGPQGALGFVVEDGRVAQVWAGSVSRDDIEPCA